MKMLSRKALLPVVVFSAISSLSAMHSSGGGGFSSNFIGQVSPIISSDEFKQRMIGHVVAAIEDGDWVLVVNAVREKEVNANSRSGTGRTLLSIAQFHAQGKPADSNNARIAAYLAGPGSNPAALKKDCIGLAFECIEAAGRGEEYALDRLKKVINDYHVGPNDTSSSGRTIMRVAQYHALGKAADSDSAKIVAFLQAVQANNTQGNNAGASDMD